MASSNVSPPVAVPTTKYGEKKKKKRRPASAGKSTKAKITKEERREKYTALARERRHNKLEKSRHSDTICFKCRKKGHMASKCTGDSNDESSASSDNICYKCGSIDHRLQDCPKLPAKFRGSKKLDYTKLGALPFAKCFICQQSGHLASQCERNDGHGIFIKGSGGGCHTCGSVTHIAAACPEKKGNNPKPDSDGLDDTTTLEQLLEDENDRIVNVSAASTSQKAIKTPKTDGKRKKVVNF
jgi:zinc finger CCHC domain-containing protein 9